MRAGRLSSPACLPFSSILKPNSVAMTTRVAKGGECLADKLLIGKRAVNFRRVEEGDTTLDRGPDHRDHLAFVSGRAVAEAHSHAPEAYGRNLQPAVS